MQRKLSLATFLEEWRQIARCSLVEKVTALWSYVFLSRFALIDSTGIVCTSFTPFSEMYFPIINLFSIIITNALCGHGKKIGSGQENCDLNFKGSVCYPTNQFAPQPDNCN